MSREFSVDTFIFFSDFCLDVVNQCVWRSGKVGTHPVEGARIDLPPKSFEVLRHLAERANEPVSATELLNAVWRDAYVQPEILRSHVAAIRQALGDSARQPRIVETVRGRGYRLIAARPNASDSVVRLAAKEMDAFVGRAQEETTFRRVLRRVSMGERQIVFVAGEAGIGKTSLVRRFRDACLEMGFTCASAGSVEGYGGGEPFYPILEALGRLCRGPSGEDVLRSIVTVAPTWALLMPAHIPEIHRRVLQDEVVGAGHDRMLREGCLLLETLATGRPLMLALDDLQWSDFATIDLLSMLAQRETLTRLMVTCTFRVTQGRTLQGGVSHLATHRRCTVLRLAPLTLEAIGTWLTAGAPPTPADQEFAHLLSERSGGNPLFIRALLEHLLELSLVCRHGDGWRPTSMAATIRSALPPTVLHALESLIQRLSADIQRMLEAASVAGTTFSAATVASAAGMMPAAFDEACQTLAGNGQFIRALDIQHFPDGSTAQRFSFQHALIGQVLYERQGIARRSASHRSIAGHLERLFPPDQRDVIASEMCRHLADSQQWDEALAYLYIALQMAKARCAHRDALALLDQGDVILSNLSSDLQLRWRMAFGEVRATLLAAAHDPNAVNAFATLVEDASRDGKVNVQLRALLGLSYVFSWTEQRRAVACLDDALRLSASLADHRVSALTQICCHTRRVWVAGWSAESDAACRAALATLRKDGDPLMVARAELEYAMLEIVSTRYAASLEHVQKSFQTLISHAREHPQIDVSRAMWMMQLGSALGHLLLGEFGQSLGQFECGVQFYRDNGNYLAARTLEVYQGWLLVHTMDYEKILLLDQQFQQAVTSGNIGDECPHAGNRDSFLAPQRRTWAVLAGLAHAELGAVAAASARFAEVEREMEREPIMLDWYWQLALDWGMSGLSDADVPGHSRERRARKFLDAALATDDRVWHALAWERMADIALGKRQLHDALKHLEAAFAATDGFDTPLADWRLHRTAQAVHLARGDEAASIRARRRFAESRLRLARTIKPETGVGTRLADLN
ncbi:Transcriptional regulator HilA [Burkholderia sp. AD24]|nr:Transcriptional regulator HilA [Burkholderia sp. AD24]